MGKWYCPGTRRMHLQNMQHGIRAKIGERFERIMTATYNTGKKELIFVEVPKWGSDFKIIHDDESSPYLSFQISNTKKDFIDEFTPGNYKIIGLFKDLTEEECKKLSGTYAVIGGNRIHKEPNWKLFVYETIKSYGLNPEKTLIIEKI